MVKWAMEGRAQRTTNNIRCVKWKHVQLKVESLRVNLLTLIMFVSGVNTASVIAKRRQELLPVQVFTESDSQPSNIAISTVAIIIICLVFGSVVLIDFVSCMAKVWRKFQGRRNAPRENNNRAQPELGEDHLGMDENFHDAETSM